MMILHYYTLTITLVIIDHILLVYFHILHLIFCKSSYCNISYCIVLHNTLNTVLKYLAILIIILLSLYFWYLMFNLPLC